MTIAQELERRMWTLADPKVRWVQRWPRPGEVCLVRNSGRPAFTADAVYWLDGFTRRYCGAMSIVFNDHIARSRRDVLLMLEEAVDQARWEGV